MSAILLSTSLVQAQDTLRVMYYNLLNFPTGGAINRQDTMAPIFAYVKPDVLLVCELTSLSGANDLLNTLNGLGIGPYQRANYVINTSSSNNLQNICFYRSDKLNLFSQDEIFTGLRDINEYQLYQINGTTGDTIWMDFYVAHLKAATGSSNEAEREAAILDLKSHLGASPSNRYRIFGGDLNIYNSSEAAYQALLFNPPTFNDPINRPGNWSNNASFDDIHTQSTRVTSFGSGASGGLDDRFDHIVVSDNIMSGTGDVQFISGSYKAVGNDGNHFNQSINDGVNLSAPPEVISALYQSSDHLPVIMDLLVNGSPIEPPVDTGGCGELFFSEYIEGSSNNKALEIYNPSGGAVDLSLYSVSVFNNGATTPNSSVSLSGSLADASTYQIVNSSAGPTLLGLADITSGVTNYNGDDAIGLYKSGVLIDVIGQIGFDPGTNWPVGSGATSEYTLVRKPEVQSGQTDWTLGAGEWLVYPVDDFSFYGSHTADPCATVETCSTTAPPTGLTSMVQASGVLLTWNELAGAQKCEVNGRPLGAPSFAKIRTNVPPYQTLVPSSKLNPGTTYEWKLRCACSISPLEVTPFSPLETFTWPILRNQQEMPDVSLSPKIYPVPASDNITIQWPLGMQDQGWVVYDSFGRIKASGTSLSQTQILDVSNWPTGIYLLRSEGFSGKILGKVILSR